MSQGSFQETGGALDLAVTGQGFFTVIQGDQVDKPFFTRDGSFNIKANGEVVTNDGLNVMGFRSVLSKPFAAYINGQTKKWFS